MHISRFQLKLTLIFLLLLLISIPITTHFIWNLVKGQTGMNVDERAEAVLQEASEIAYDMIAEAEAGCQSIAEAILSDEKFSAAFGSEDGLESIVAEIMPPGSDLSVVIFDFEKKAAVRLSTGGEDVPNSIISSLKQDNAPRSYQEGDMVYGVAPIFEGDNLAGAAVVYRKLKGELVRHIINLQNLLSIYTIRPDLDKIMWTQVVTMFVVLIIAGAILGWLFARGVTKPILTLVAGTREVARGDLNHKVMVKGKDEIAVLMESFNAMTSQLKAGRERAVRAERLAAWRNVARSIAHEIKNPLTPIQLSMYRLRKNLGSERYGQIFDQAYTSIINEVENLRNMVTEFSDFARMPKPRTKPTDPKEIVQDAISLYTGLPDSIALHTELADNLPQVMADPDQIRQVLHNLIGNAVDAMPDGGKLSVIMRQEINNVVIEISDTGCGMSEEIREKMFTPYFTTKETGTGLGMAITAQIIEEHDGEITVESEESVGTTVTVKLKTSESALW